MSASERATLFPIGDAEAVGILHRPQAQAALGVVVIVGGPQYRVGSHRQFVLLARALAAAGIPAFRFDYRGLGDSTGAARDFEQIDTDIRAAVDRFVELAGVEQVVLWGLCDAASAALMYAQTDRRIAGLVLLNPWVHSPGTEAKVRLKTYYMGRLRNREFWRKLARLDLDWRDSAGSLWQYVLRATGTSSAGAASPGGHFIERMRCGWEGFAGPVLLILSGDDLTAAEFSQLIAQSPRWQALLAAKPVRTVALPEANHTFARADWRSAVEHETLAWLNDLRGNEGGAG